LKFRYWYIVEALKIMASAKLPERRIRDWDL
jgi:hypothetical protein